MNATRTIDLEDTEGLLAADRDGLLRAASMAGAQVRAVAAALDEGALDSLRGRRPSAQRDLGGRAGHRRDRGRHAGRDVGGAASAPIVVAAEAPPWVGALDVLIVAGDDPGDPGAGRGRRERGAPRCAGVVVAAPYEGPLRDATAGRVAVLEPRLPVADEFGLCRYLAAGLAVLHTVDPRSGVDLAALADELDAEALRNSAGREVFTNPAKTMVARISGRRVVLAGDNAATLALARHGSSVLLRIAHQVAAAAGLADAVPRCGAGPVFVRPGGCAVPRRGDRRAAARAAAGAGVDIGRRADGRRRPGRRARRRRLVGRRGRAGR